MVTSCHLKGFYFYPSKATQPPSTSLKTPSLRETFAWYLTSGRAKANKRCSGCGMLWSTTARLLREPKAQRRLAQVCAAAAKAGGDLKAGTRLRVGDDHIRRANLENTFVEILKARHGGLAPIVTGCVQLLSHQDPSRGLNVQKAPEHL